MRPIVLGASNMWFPVVLSSIAVPTTSVKIDQLVETNWVTLQGVISKEVLKAFRQIGQLGELTTYEDDDIWEAIQRRQQDSGEDTESEEPPDLKEPEWKVFTGSHPDVNSDDFRLRPIDVPDAYTAVIDRVVLVERMREVRAITGFTQLDSPSEFSELSASDTM